MNEGMASTLVPRKRLKVVTRMVERAIQTIIVRLKSAPMGLKRNLSTSIPNAAAARTVRGKATNPGNSSLDHQQVAAVGGCHEDGAVGQVEYPQQVEDERESDAHEDVDHREQDHVDHCLNYQSPAFNQSSRLVAFPKSKEPAGAGPGATAPRTGRLVLPCQLAIVPLRGHIREASRACTRPDRR